MDTSASCASSYAKTRYSLVFADGVGESKLAKILEVSTRSLKQAGLEVEEGRSKSELIVRAPMTILEEEAEQAEFLKRRLIDGETEDFVAEESEKYEKLTPSEEAFLLWTHVEHVPCADVKVLEEFVGRDRVELARSSLVKSLVGICECSPLHDDELVKGMMKRWWTLDSNEVAAYFGPNVAMYFVFMDMFTRWLMFPAVLGIISYLRRLYVGVSIDDDPFVPAYSLVVALWGISFVTFIPREQASYALKWQCLDEDILAATRSDEAPRPEFKGVVVVSPVTGRPTKYYAPWKRFVAYALSTVVTAAMLVVASCWHVVSLNFQGYVQNDNWTERYAYIGAVASRSTYFVEGNAIVALVPTIVHVLMVQQMNAIYRYVATWLTDFENHATDTDHENALALKRFLFEAFDAYAVLFYLAFLDFDLVKLRAELVSIYMVDTFRRVALESLLPLVQERYFSSGDSEEKMEYEQFDDYLEMVIEVGYLTLFAAAFPLAPALSVACNIAEGKNDVFKLLFVTRRPTVERDATIGVWLNILVAMAWLSIATNVGLVAFTSDQLAFLVPSLFSKNEAADPLLTPGDDFVYKAGKGQYVVLCAALIEHATAVVAALITAAVPKTPKPVLDDIARRQYEKTVAARKLRHTRLLQSRKDQ